ncbi:recombinase A [Pseudomonas phage hairong]|nr:recombinase A [Pseudomonas phage hairong]
MAKAPTKTAGAAGLAAALAGLIGENAEQIGIKNYLATGIPELDAALSGVFEGGGFAGGRMIEIFGPASSGKTFLATMAMKAAQDAGGIAGFSDHERSFEPKLAASLGMDVSSTSGRFVYKRPETFEDSIRIAMNFCEGVRKNKLIADDAPLIWVFDSVASMVPHDKLYDEKGKRRTDRYNMKDKLALATSTSQNYPQLAQFAEDYNMTVILLNQIRTKPGVMYGDPTTTPGGNAAEFYCSTRISLGRKMITNGEKDPDKKETLGQEITAMVVKNKVTRPFVRAKWRVMYNMKGFGAYVDVIGSTLDFLVRKELIPKDGNYLIWEGKKKYQSQIEAALATDPDAMKKLRAMLPDKVEDLTSVEVEHESLPTEGGDIEMGEAESEEA